MGFSFNEILQTKMLTKLEENVNFLKLKPKSAKKARSQRAASPLAIAATYSVHAGQQSAWLVRQARRKNYTSKLRAKRKALLQNN